MQDYHHLKVWERSHAFALAVRAEVGRMPRRGFHRLRKQLIDSGESILWNIVEGCGATSRKEFARFLGMSIRSTMEEQGQLEQARDALAMKAESCASLTREVVEIRKMLCGLRAAVLRAESEDGD